MNGRGWQHVLWVAVPACVLAGCSSEEPGDVAADGGQGDATSQAAEQSPSSSAPIGPGTHQLSFMTPDGVEGPDVLLEIPEGFQDSAVQGEVAADGLGWYVVSDAGTEFLGLSMVTWVQRDACSHLEDTVTPGPSVAELVDAIAAQDSTDASEPEPVTLAGYDGTYLELAGPADLGTCGGHPWLWETRGLYSDGQVDRLWILDVDGQRLVVDAAYSKPNSPASGVERLAAMVDSLEFVTPAG